MYNSYTTGLTIAAGIIFLLWISALLAGFTFNRRPPTALIIDKEPPNMDKEYKIELDFVFNSDLVDNLDIITGYNLGYRRVDNEPYTGNRVYKITGTKRNILSYLRNIIDEDINFFNQYATLI